MKQANGLVIFLLLILLGIPFFIHLDRLPIRLWDEARLALNAYEMVQNKNLLVTHFEGQPDMWNTKPPLLIWAQAAFISVLGFNEWAVRLPVAIAGFFTCLLLLWFSKVCLRNYWPGLLAAFVLVTTDGYIHIHGSRTGDYDVPLAFFTTAYCLSFFLYLEKKQPRFLHLFFLSLALAILTKSVQGLLFLPALLLYSLYRKEFIFLLKNPLFYRDALLCLGLIAAYYLGREHVNPGYLQAIWENELGGRYLNTLEDNQQGSQYYLQLLYGFHFAYWIWFLPLGLLLLIRQSNKAVRKLYVYGLLLSGTYLLIISLAGTKLEWYDIPLFPWLSLMVALSLYQAYLLLRQHTHNSYSTALPALMLLLVFAFPYQHILRKTYKPSDYAWEKDLYPISYLLKSAINQPGTYDQYTICYSDYDQHLKFYITRYQEEGSRLVLKPINSLQPGEKVIAMEAEVLKQIEAEFSYRLLEEHAQVKVYQLLAQK